MPRPRHPKPASRLRLGPGGMVYVVVTGLIVGAATYTQANLLFWAFGLMIGGFVVSVLIAWQSLRAIEVLRLVPSHGVCGEPLVLRYQIKNRSWLPAFSIVVQETWGKGGRGWKRTGPVAVKPQKLKGRPTGWVLHLGPNQAIQAEATCWPLRRGRLDFERVVVSSSFPFGIVRKVVEFKQTSEVLVYPHLFRMNRRLLFSISNLDPSGRKQVDRGGGTEEFYGIRPYRYGDSLKLIDWKRTAHTGELVAREMTQPSPPRVMVLLDLTQTSGRPARAGASTGTEGKSKIVAAIKGQKPPRPKGCVDVAHMSDEEKAIALTASLVTDAHFHGYQIGLAVLGPRCGYFPVHHSLPHRTKILEALASLDLTETGGSPMNPAERASVIIWPGPGDASPRHLAGSDGSRTAAVIGAADLEQYVAGAAEGSELLRRRVKPATRREELEERGNATTESVRA